MTAITNELAARVHADNEHFWRDLKTGAKIPGNLGRCLMLMTSEIAEAMEGERKNLLDDHLPHRKMAEVELADFVIRALDAAGGFGINIENPQAGDFLPHMPEDKAEALLQIVTQIVKAKSPLPSSQSYHLTRAVRLAERYAYAHGYDLNGAVSEKRAYNAVRADHKAEARLAAGGKKW